MSSSVEPDGGPRGSDRLRPLVEGNARFQQHGRTSYEPQHPRFVVDNCGRLDPVIIHQQHELGALFDVSSRGLHAPDQHLASIWFALTRTRPGPSVLEILVHECVRGGLCRMPPPAGEAVQPLHIRASPVRSWKEGVRTIDMPVRDRLPYADLAHARANTIKILEYSDQVHRQVADGDLLIAEAWYDNRTGAVRYASFLSSADPTRGVHEPTLRAIAEGQTEAARTDAHPALKNLAALVAGNQAHVARFVPPVPTEFIVFGCADSRTAPAIVFDTPNGQIEIVRNAGNAVHAAILRSLRISVEEALGQRDAVTLVVLAHTRCGAVQATLADSGREGLGEVEALPIVHSLEHRFERYRGLHPDFATSDPQLIEAAGHNATAAAAEIVGAPGHDGECLRALMAMGRLQVVPARYLLKSGRVDFFPPLTPPER